MNRSATCRGPLHPGYSAHPVRTRTQNCVPQPGLPLRGRSARPDPPYFSPICMHSDVLRAAPINPHRGNCCERITVQGPGQQGVTMAATGHQINEWIDLVDDVLRRPVLPGWHRQVLPQLSSTFDAAASWNWFLSDGTIGVEAY